MGLHPSRDPRLGERRSWHLCISDTNRAEHKAPWCGLLWHRRNPPLSLTEMCREASPVKNGKQRFWRSAWNEGPSHTPTTCSCPLTPPGQPISFPQPMNPVRFSQTQGKLAISQVPLCPGVQRTPLALHPCATSDHVQAMGWLGKVPAACGSAAPSHITHTSPITPLLFIMASIDKVPWKSDWKAACPSKPSVFRSRN